MKKTTTVRELGVLLCTVLIMLLFQGCSKDEMVDSLYSSNATNIKAQQLEPCVEACLVAGQNQQVGTVSAALADNGDLQVTYTITAAGVYLLETHLDAFSSPEQLQTLGKLKNGNPVPGKFAFKQSWDVKQKVTTYTATIPSAYIADLGDCFYIVSHAALSNGETAWGGLCTQSATGVSLENAINFTGRNWATYFQFCRTACYTPGISFSYAWEDIGNGAKAQNDGDYNDLIVQSKVERTVNALKLTFLATARGADYDHQFKFKIPKAGITLPITGAESVEEVGNDYIVTVFKSTKEALPANVGIFTNTMLGAPCTPFATKVINISTNEAFVYDAAIPYEPFITVYVSGTAGEGHNYDLYVHSISGRDTWTKAVSNEIFPNGIVIPGDWRWPLERKFIKEVYPDFTSLSEGFTPNWHQTLALPAETFDKNTCL